MKIDFEYIKWLASEGEKIAERVVPLVAQILNVDAEKLMGFVKYVRQATDSVLSAIELVINFPAVFGADGDGLTDTDGNLRPDCPCPAEYASIVWALKAQAVAA
jgi:hypothetical protein